MLVYSGPLLCGFNVAIKGFRGARLLVQQRPNDGDPLRPPSDPRQARRRLRRSSAATGVPLAYVPGQWSACTRACGGAGLQSRRVACEVRGMPDYRLAVIERHCAHRELVKPNDMQDCGYVMCPMWEAGPWSEVRPNYYSTCTLTRNHSVLCLMGVNIQILHFAVSLASVLKTDYL